ncbi:hypothetical protein [Azospirillum sp. SYSU D00513]|uniref:hypothetical protein n=1 Tax=Azospirillum sp. SYSU D00513 TaxID=2812561 RepID=UPI001FFEC3C2|nr:hypothetical protein [Azospirillum sp. SYSU D00513]
MSMLRCTAMLQVTMEPQHGPTSGLGVIGEVSVRLAAAGAVRLQTHCQNGSTITRPAIARTATTMPVVIQEGTDWNEGRHHHAQNLVT